MSLRTKAAEIKAAGEAERGNFNPTGAPKQLYNFWLRNTKSEKGRKIRSGLRKENFCHFWRVVAIWAPLMGIKVGIANALDHEAIWTVVACVLTGFILITTGATGQWDILLWILGVSAVVIYSVGGLIVGGIQYFDVHENAKQDRDPLIRNLFIAGIPTAALTYGFFSILGFVAEHPKVQKALIIAFFSVCGLAVAGMLLIVALDSIWYIVGLAGIVAAFAGLFASVHGIASFVHYRRKKKRDERRAVIDNMTDEEYEAYMSRPLQTAKPSALMVRLEKIFSGIGDFVIFASQIARVHKWKICPLVEIDEEAA